MIRDEIEAMVLGSGHRLTDSRQQVIEQLLACDGHLSADSLYQQLQQKGSLVGRMTVFRTLDLLADIGVIRPIYQGTGAAHYIVMMGGCHHHFICNRCHTIIEFSECFTTSLAEELAKKFNFHISSHLLELHGLCASCR